jgi:hypothetical protein
MKQLKTYEDACKVEGIDPKQIELDVLKVPETDRQMVTLYYKLIVIIRAANRLSHGNNWLSFISKEAEIYIGNEFMDTFKKLGVVDYKLSTQSKEYKYDHEAIKRIKHDLENFEVMQPGDDVIYYDNTRNEFKGKIKTVFDVTKNYQPASIILESGEIIALAIRTSYLTHGRFIGMVTVSGYVQVKNYIAPAIR